jgi:DNA-binding response OmpR family regulator
VQTVTRILVIEDAQPLRKDIVEMLTFEGFEVIGAENGIAGVESALETNPDLIICDIMMPELDGYGVLERLRQEPAARTTPFVFLTARTDRSDIRQGMDMGAEDYLTKPFAASELLSTVRAQLHKRDVFEQMSHQKLDELRDSIILSLPHELRTPLTSILGFSDILM